MKTAFALIACSFAFAMPANALTLVFDENAYPTNPINGFGGFTFGDFSPGGAVTFGTDSLFLDIVDEDTVNGVFGGVGVDYVIEEPTGSGTFVPQDLDPTKHRFEMRIKLLGGNEATGINAAIIDDDGAGSADDHQFNFDLTGVPNDDQFHLITASLLTPGFTQGAFGFTPGDGEVNPGLRQIQIQSQFGSTGRLNVEVDFLQIVPIVPEPTSALLLSVAMAAMAHRRCR